MREDISTAFSLYEKLFLSYNDLDWIRTLVYVIGTSGGWGLIYLNRALSGDSLIRTIRKELAEIRTQSGEKIVEEVYEKKEAYEGEFLDDAPDLLVKFKEGYVSYPIHSDDKMIDDTPLDITGGHQEGGILYIYGYDIRKGLTLNSRIVDVAPTLLYMYDSPIPKDMDGRLLLEAFEQGSKILARKPKYTELSESDVKERALGQVYTKEEEQYIKRRLKSLGYL